MSNSVKWNAAGKESSTPARSSILIINPNTSTPMTDALKPIIRNLNIQHVNFEYFTAPPEPTIGPDGDEIKGIPSINSGADSTLSAQHCWPHLQPLIPEYDAFLVACYSAHPLVGMLNEQIRANAARTSAEGKPRSRKQYVTGIFEASVSKSLYILRATQKYIPDANAGKGLQLSEPGSSFGIISTGSVWKEDLGNAVPPLLHRIFDFGHSPPSLELFAGVETTGLNAVELHTTPAVEVDKRMEEAAERLIKNAARRVAAICLGCAGMVGMEQAVRRGCVKALGLEEGEKVVIVDGVVAGVYELVSSCAFGF